MNPDDPNIYGVVYDRFNNLIIKSNAGKLTWDEAVKELIRCSYILG